MPVYEAGGRAMAGKENKSEGGKHRRYTTRIIKAGALVSDTKTLLAHWDFTRLADENLRRFREENLFGKATRSRVEDILGIFRQRYLKHEEVTKALATLVKKRLPSTSLDQILYFHSAKSDSLLHDFVTDILLPRKNRGVTDIEALDVERNLEKWVAAGKTTSKWSNYTIHRVTQGLLATLRDFGILEGAVKKRLSSSFLPTEAFAYVMFYLRRSQPSGAKLIDLPDWKLFFLEPDAVERLLFEAHQKDLLEYHAAGTVTRLTFPVQSLEEYANVLVTRAH